MNYTDYVTSLQTLLVIQDASGLANLQTILPRMIEYAELRMYRDPDLDFLATRTSDISAQTASGSRDVAIPTQFIVIEQANIILPAGVKPPTVGAQRVPLLRASQSFLDQIWPIDSDVATPAPFENYFSVYSEQETGAGASKIRIAPTPDGTYYVEFRGTFRPTALSAANPNTFLTTYMPDLFLAASMIFGAGYQRDFGAQSENPQMSLSWEQIYSGSKQGAAVEEARKKSTSYDWSSNSPPKLAMPPEPPARG